MWRQGSDEPEKRHLGRKVGTGQHGSTGHRQSLREQIVDHGVLPATHRENLTVLGLYIELHHAGSVSGLLQTHHAETRDPDGDVGQADLVGVRHRDRHRRDLSHRHAHRVDGHVGGHDSLEVHDVRDTVVGGDCQGDLTRRQDRYVEDDFCVAGGVGHGGAVYDSVPVEASRRACHLRHLHHETGHTQRHDGEVVDHHLSCRLRAYGQGRVTEDRPVPELVLT